MRLKLSCWLTPPMPLIHSIVKPHSQHQHHLPITSSASDKHLQGFTGDHTRQPLGNGNVCSRNNTTYQPAERKLPRSPTSLVQEHQPAEISDHGGWSWTLVRISVRKQEHEEGAMEAFADTDIHITTHKIFNYPWNRVQTSQEMKSVATSCKKVFTCTIYQQCRIKVFCTFIHLVWLASMLKQWHILWCSLICTCHINFSVLTACRGLHKDNNSNKSKWFVLHSAIWNSSLLICCCVNQYCRVKNLERPHYTRA